MTFTNILSFVAFVAAVAAAAIEFFANSAVNSL